MSKLDFGEFLEAARVSDLEEIPVDIETFVYGEDYLDMRAKNAKFTLGEHQITCIQASTQIYTLKTLREIMPEDRAQKRFDQTNNEVVLALGKGSGKDQMSAISCAYIVYLLLCLKDPQQYYNMGGSIAILNVAINATQARNVFFAYVKTLIKRSPWFEGRYDQASDYNREPSRADEISFDKDITLYSGHSEREGWEGYNLIAVFLDEIAGFSMDKDSTKSAGAIYDTYRAAVRSRFADFGKLVLLSFTRFKGDFISQRYEAVIGSRDVINRSHVFQIDPDSPPGTPDNEFEIQWEEDHITHYRVRKTFALRRPTWEVNPTKNIDMYAQDFYENPADTMGRVACQPPDAVDAYIKDSEKILSALRGRNGVDNETGRFQEWFLPDATMKYYIHVDLAFKHDRCAVAMSHVDKFITSRDGLIEEVQPYVVVDALRYWTPTKSRDIDFVEVLDYILSLISRNFNVRLVTYDQWYSKLIQESLDARGIKNQKLSVQKPEFNDLMYAIMGERVVIPDDSILRDELKSLRITKNNKIDHPRTGAGSDLAVATAGSVHNAIANTPKAGNTVIEVVDYQTRRREERMKPISNRPGTVIHAPPRRIPADLDRFLGGVV